MSKKRIAKSKNPYKKKKTTTQTIKKTYEQQRQSEKEERRILVNFSKAIRDGRIMHDDLVRLGISALPSNYEHQKHTNLIKQIAKKYGIR